MKTAIIGLGVIGDVHLEVLRAQGKNIVAVCDINESKFSKCQEALHYTDYKKMIDEVMPDVVHICTPHYLHAEMIIYALNKNVNVLAEKPLCISFEEIDAILEAEKNSKAILGVSLQTRYTPASQYVKDFLKGKKVEHGLGVVSWIRDDAYYAQDAWRGKWATEGGGVMINQAIHTLDRLMWYAGEPDYVVATTSNLTHKNSIEVEDTVSAIFTGENGNFTFFATNSAYKDFPVRISLKVDGKELMVLPTYMIYDGKVIEFPKNYKILGKECYGEGHVYLIDEFYSCVKEGRKFPVDGKEASKVLKLILSIYKSNGEKIKIEK